jgi:hypothetical protein
MTNACDPTSVLPRRAQNEFLFTAMQSHASYFFDVVLWLQTNFWSGATIATF